MKNLLFFGLLLVFSSVQSQSNLDSASLDFFYPKSFHKFQKKTEKGSKAEYNLIPHLSVQTGGDSKHTLVGEVFSLLDLQYCKHNLRVNLAPFVSASKLSDNMSHFLDSIGVNSAFGIVNLESHYSSVANFEFRLNYQLSKHFNAEVGRGRNFLGNGYRSMVLGNTHAPYPFLKLTTKAWRFKYVNIFSRHKGITGTFVNPKFRHKYSTLHAIDLKLAERLTFSIFESVIWQATDTLSNRGFDMNYLNPVIFFRPVEFAQGSADNVLLGMGLRYLHKKSTLVYSQLFLDEFLFDNVRANTGWWANKVGAQLGIKSKINQELTGYSEFNLARPFTYSHGSVLQNYGHMNQSLAHPLGANFMEWTSGVEYEKNDLILNLRFNWALYGRDSDGENYGGNIFTSYKAPFRVFGNVIGQGNTHHSYITQLSASKKLNEKIWAFGTYNWRHVKSNFQKVDEHVFQLGIGLDPHKLFSRDLENNQFRFSNDF